MWTLFFLFLNFAEPRMWVERLADYEAGVYNSLIQ